MLKDSEFAQRPVVGIMCKAPIPGVTKTRLAAAVGQDLAGALAGAFTRDVAAAIEAVPTSYRVQGFGVYAPAGTEAALRNFLPASFGLLLQSGATLGDALHGATAHLLGRGAECVLLVNGDSPTLPARYLTEAIDILRRPGDRVVLGPASDGGYYLIGLKHPHRFLFENIPWSTGAVLQRTLDNAQHHGLPADCLGEWYDVDDAPTYRCLLDELNGRSRKFTGGGPAHATRACLAAAAMPGA